MKVFVIRSSYEPLYHKNRMLWTCRLNRPLESSVSTVLVPILHMICNRISYRRANLCDDVWFVERQIFGWSVCGSTRIYVDLYVWSGNRWTGIGENRRELPNASARNELKRGGIFSDEQKESRRTTKLHIWMERDHRWYITGPLCSRTLKFELFRRETFFGYCVRLRRLDC